MYSYKWLPTFRRHILIPSSGSWVGWGIDCVIQADCNEYGYSEPSEAGRSWIPVRFSRYGEQVSCPFQYHSTDDSIFLRNVCICMQDYVMFWMWVSTFLSASLYITQLIRYPPHFRLDGGGNIFLRSVGICLQDSLHRRPYSLKDYGLEDLKR
jgi:hypothetical protein